jgi:hypothetical protein
VIALSLFTVGALDYPFGRDPWHCYQHDGHACKHHRRGHRTDNKNALAHPLQPSLCGVEENGRLT